LKHRRLTGNDRRCLPRNEFGENVPAATNGLGDQHATFDDEQPFFRAGRSARKQAPQLLNALV
jgi:hypothetical protein